MAEQSKNDNGGGSLDRYFSDPEYRKELRKRKRWGWLTPKVRLGLIAGAVAGGLLSVYTVYLFSGLPSLEKIENPRPELATTVYAVDGEVLDKFYIKNRSQVSLSELPDHVVKALIATEDKGFYSHWGVDVIRFMKAMVKNLLTLFQRREGASTITQQLSRSLYLGMDDRNVFGTITRKFREFITAIQLERAFTKDEILEFYLNVVWFGRGSYGIASAASIYFGKQPSELTLTEGAMLIALLRGPAYYDPANHPERAKGRRDLVISQMEKYKFISPEQADAARAGAGGLVRVRPQLPLETLKLGHHVVGDGLHRGCPADVGVLDEHCHRLDVGRIDQRVAG